MVRLQLTPNCIIKKEPRLSPHKGISSRIFCSFPKRGLIKYIDSLLDEWDWWADDTCHPVRSCGSDSCIVQCRFCPARSDAAKPVNYVDVNNLSVALWAVIPEHILLDADALTFIAVLILNRQAAIDSDLWHGPPLLSNYVGLAYALLLSVVIISPFSWQPGSAAISSAPWNCFGFAFWILL